MQLDQSFEVHAPAERVWEALIDVERVAPCLPGAAVSDRNEDGSFNGTFNVKVGPTAASYTGTLVLESVDDQARRATIGAQGTDRRGQGGASATIVSAVTAIDPGSSRVEVSTEYQITGRLARFGRGGMIEEIGNRLLREFSDRLREMLAVTGETAAEPAGDGPAGAAPAVSEAAEESPTVAMPAVSEAAEGSPTVAMPAVSEAAEKAPADSVPAPDVPLPAIADVEPAWDLTPAPSGLWARARANPVPLIALVLGFLAALRVLRRREQ
ncbi:MAG: SRPBCC domain-containing protein [Solirubrobacteraceae bacterium]